MRRVLLIVLILAVPSRADEPRATPAAGRLRVACFNIWELSAEKLAAVDEIGRGSHSQLRGAAEIVQRVRPDVLLVNEIDGDKQHRSATMFRDRYLAIGQNGQQPLNYPYIFVAPVNTGVATGLDLDNDGKSDGPGDAQGFGKYPGQYGMAVYSRYPIVEGQVRTFQKLLWRDQPGNLLPDGADGKPAWYEPGEAEVLRLSSKSHWDVPIEATGRVLHLLCAHPTPPVFDGPEDRNGRRNHDEIRLWADYIAGGAVAEYIVDDAGRRGGLPAEACFVIAGDLNADPQIGETVSGKHPIRLLLDHPRVQDPAPTSEGSSEEDPAGARRQDRTSRFGRLDYVLPSRDLRVLEAGVFWPARERSGAELVSDRANSSDHRLVWVDLAWP